MNQWIKIRYKPFWHFNPNYWNIWFVLNDKEHRGKAPSNLDLYGDWGCYFHDVELERGRDFDWKS